MMIAAATMQHWQVSCTHHTVRYSSCCIEIYILLLQICAGPRVQTLYDSVDAKPDVPWSSLMFPEPGKYVFFQYSAVKCFHVCRGLVFSKKFHCWWLYANCSHSYCICVSIKVCESSVNLALLWKTWWLSICHRAGACTRVDAQGVATALTIDHRLDGNKEE